MTKVIIKGAHIADCRNLWSRHATPKKFCHILLDSVRGKGILNAIDPNASGLYIAGHPTLGNWDAIPLNFKRQGGGEPMVSWLGLQPPREPLTTEEFANLDTIEIYVLGHVKRYINGTANDGSKYLALELTNTTLLNSIAANYIVWQTGESWSSVSDKYKASNGSALVNTDDATDVEVIG